MTRVKANKTVPSAVSRSTEDACCSTVQYSTVLYCRIARLSLVYSTVLYCVLWWVFVVLCQWRRPRAKTRRRSAKTRKRLATHASKASLLRDETAQRCRGRFPLPNPNPTEGSDVSRVLSTQHPTSTMITCTLAEVGASFPTRGLSCWQKEAPYCRRL